LLRKAIKLTLQDPREVRHRAFADGLLAIYHEANRLKRDRRYHEAGRQGAVEKLLEKVFALCDPVWREKWSPDDPLGHDRCNLALEILRLLDKDELFAFVTAKPVERPNGTWQTVGGTNNEAERTLRKPARARKTGQTSKTPLGARRTSILTSVLESLRLYLPTYTLGSVLEEMKRWQEAGKSCFRQLLEKLKLSLPDGAFWIVSFPSQVAKKTRSIPRQPTQLSNRLHVDPPPHAHKLDGYLLLVRSAYFLIRGCLVLGKCKQRVAPQLARAAKI